ncbi:MAG TPA: response regulator [Thermoanaerobaculaceae bacterium]|nr:response regulator [Thermoanaerobaculaceae bacterium]
MTDVAKLLEALATIAWPVIVILLILLFRPAVAALIESARSRKFTLKIGGQELTMEEASEQQRNLIADLQAQVVEIRERIGRPVAEAPQAEAHLNGRHFAGAVLWVDDQPKNNSFLVGQLTDKGVNVDLALSTSEGLRMFGDRTYAVVVSDMGRTEDGIFKSTAGLELLRQIRASKGTVPFIFYTTFRATREYRTEALSLGATAITSSPTEILGLLQSAFGAKT